MKIPYLLIASAFVTLNSVANALLFLEANLFMNSEAIDKLIEAQPKLASSRKKLESMQAGAYCIHRSWGFGQIQSYDDAQDRLIIDFEDDKTGHPMAPAFCVDKLEVLPEQHMLVRKRTEADLVDKMIKKDQAELVVEILKTHENHSASSREIEKVLNPLLGPTKAKKWWTATKKILVKDPRIAVPSRATEPYVLREEEIKPEEEILDEFREMKKPKDKILLAEKLLILSNDRSELKDELPALLEELTRLIVEAKRLNQADRLHGVWVRNDLARDIEEDVELLEPTSGSIIKETENLSDLVKDLPSSYQKRFLDLITRTYVEDWTDYVIQLLRESSGKFTSECINFLLEREKRDLLVETLFNLHNEQLFKGPVLLWILKNRSSKKYGELLESLMTPRLLSAVFHAIDNEALHNASTRRIPLAEAVSDDNELIATLLKEADLETARDLAQTLLLNQGFEDLTKKSILARFINIHGSIQSLLEGGDSSAEAAPSEEALFVSESSFNDRKLELEELINKKIPENKEAIVRAREHGDLRENAEYKMARDDQNLLMARRGQLEDEISKAQIADFSSVGTDTIGIGSVVELLEDGSSDPVTYSILGAWDGDPDKNIMSYKTPLAKSLLTKKVGDTVETEIAGNKTKWNIQSIKRWIDIA